MSNLILKDYIFTRKQLLISVLFCLATPILLVIDGGVRILGTVFYSYSFYLVMERKEEESKIIKIYGGITMKMNKS